MVGDLNKKGSERLTGNLLWIGWCGKTSGQGDIYAWGRRKTCLGEQRAQEDLRKEEQTLRMPGRELGLFEEQMGGQCCWSMASNVFFSEKPDSSCKYLFWKTLFRPFPVCFSHVWGSKASIGPAAAWENQSTFDF